MAIYESVLKREFKEMMDSRRSVNTSFSIMQIDVPDLGLIISDDFIDKVKGRKAIIKGIAEDYFKDLNSNCKNCKYYAGNGCSKDMNKDVCPMRTVEIAKGTSFEKKMAMRVNGEDGKSNSVYRTDKEGKEITTTVSVEPGFVAVYSPINIHLPNRVKNRLGNMVDYKPSHKGYSFIRCDETPNGKRYLYTVPKECVYPVELCALVISLNRHSAFYKGCKVALTNGHYVYLYSIPYKYRENRGYRVIGAKTNPNFDEEMKFLLNFWMEKQILFDLNLTALDNQYEGKNNLGIEDLPAPMTYSYDTYIETKGALKELEKTDEEYAEDMV